MPDSQYYGQTLGDSGDENGTFSVTIGVVTALTLPGILSAATDFEEALFLTDFILGSTKRKFMTAFDQAPAYTLDTDANNQQENRWLCRYHNPTTGKKWRLTIPTANLTKLPIVAGKRSEFVELSTGDGATFKTAFEAFVKDPDTFGAVILDSIQYVSRN